MKTPMIVLLGTLISMGFANNVNTGGLSGINKTYSAYSIGQGSYQFGMSIKGEYGDEALYQLLPNRAIKDVMLLTQNINLALGFTNWMDFAVDLPFHEDIIPELENSTSGFGDLAVSLKLMHPDMKPDALIRLAYIMRVSFPTGDPVTGYYPRDPQYSHVSTINNTGAHTSDGYSLNPMLAWTFDLTRLKIPKPLLVHVNFGMDALVWTKEDVNIPEENSAMQGGLALEWLCEKDWSLFLDFYGKSRIINVTAGPFWEIFARDQLNLAVGTKKVYQSGWSAALSFEGSLSTQENHTRWATTHENDGVRRYNVQPTPILGATLSIGFGGIGKDADSDFDESPNSIDKCPQDAEDYDGYQDEDGCPDPIHVAVAPVVIRDTVIKIMRDTVTVTKKDTVRVAVVDSLAYKVQQDPNAIFGFGKTTFRAITFKSGSNALNPTSFKTLNDIAQSLKTYPEVLLEVVGYTDNKGDEARNLDLSKSRADAVVNYLVKKGADASHLQAVGLGTANPVGSNTTAEGRLLNRRVEFKRIK